MLKCVDLLVKEFDVEKKKSDDILPLVLVKIILPYSSIWVGQDKGTKQGNFSEGLKLQKLEKLHASVFLLDFKTNQVAEQRPRGLSDWVTALMLINEVNNRIEINK